MKISRLLLCILTSTLSSFSLASPEIVVSSPELKITSISPGGTVEVALRNSTTVPIKLWERWNSWGAMTFRVLRYRAGELETLYENPHRMFTRNFPSFKELTAGQHLEVGLDLNGGDWCWREHCARWDERGIGSRKVAFEDGDLIFVVYDVPSSEAATRLGVWFGVIATSAVFNRNQSNSRHDDPDDRTASP